MSSSHLVQHRQQEAANKRQAVLDAIPRIVARGEAVTAARVAQEAGTGRTFLYEHPDLIEAIRAARGQQENPSTEPAQVKALRVENARLRDRLKAERKTTDDLRRQLRRAWGSAIEDVPHAELTQRITELETRNVEVVRQLREMENEYADTVALLEQTQEQLESARAVNRDLMREQNRQPAG